MNENINIFISYSHQDDELWVSKSSKNKLVTWLEERLASNVVFFSEHTRQVLKSKEYENLIKEKLDNSSIAILLISHYYIDSLEIFDLEIPYIKLQNTNGSLHIIPVILNELTIRELEKIGWLFDLKNVSTIYLSRKDEEAKSLKQNVFDDITRLIIEQQRSIIEVNNANKSKKIIIKNENEFNNIEKIIEPAIKEDTEDKKLKPTSLIGENNFHVKSSEIKNENSKGKSNTFSSNVNEDKIKTFWWESRYKSSKTKIYEWLLPIVIILFLFVVIIVIHKPKKLKNSFDIHSDLDSEGNTEQIIDDSGKNDLKNGDSLYRARKFYFALLSYKKGAEKGNAISQYNVGNMYENGIGVAKDINLAHNYYSQACSNGYIYACKANTKLNKIISH